jgi:hypothetical protein
MVKNYLATSTGSSYLNNLRMSIDDQMLNLTQDKALIFRITHIDNVRWILQHGLYCRSANVFDPNFHEIGNPELIEKRKHRNVPIQPGGTLSDYIPFYFTPHSPMLLNIKTGFMGMKKTPMSEIAILVSSLPNLAQVGKKFLFTDRHACLQTAAFYNDLARLDVIDWSMLQNRDFKRNPNDPAKFERYQAEALIYHDLPVSTLVGIVCHGEDQKNILQAEVERAGQNLKVLVRIDWYF